MKVLTLAAAVWVLTACSPFAAAADDRERRDLAKFGPVVTFPWMHERTIQSVVEDPVDGVRRLYSFDTDVPELIAARTAYLPVALYQMASFKMTERSAIATVGDLIDLAELIRAAVIKKYEIAARVIVQQLLGYSLDNVKKRAAHELMGRGVKLHSEMWQDHLVPVAKRTSGPAATRPPLAISVNCEPPSTPGLQLKNISGRRLRGVTLEVRSGFAANEVVDHPGCYFYIADWPDQQLITVPPFTALRAMMLEILSDTSLVLAYSLWSDDLTATDVRVRLPKDEYERVRAKRPRTYRFDLEQDGRWAPPPQKNTAPVPPASTRVPFVPVPAAKPRPWDDVLRGGDADELISRAPEATSKMSSAGLLEFADAVMNEHGVYAAKWKSHPRLLELAAEAARRAAARDDGLKFLALETEAKCHWLRGDAPKAAQIQWDAVYCAPEIERERAWSTHKRYVDETRKK